SSSDLFVVMDFDTSSGTFSNPTPITTLLGSGNYGGAEFSPDGTYIYYSLGNQLYRIPSNDLSASSELIPIEAPGTPPVDLFAIYDIKVGPDGNLYYIYEEVEGGPQLMGKVTNPNEVDLALIEVAEDPFAGTDFCGTIFPTFAPNADIAPTVDFTWAPNEPCANNPVQLTSQLTPENYRPVSFEWAFSPPLLDSAGNELEVNYSQEHF